MVESEGQARSRNKPTMRYNTRNTADHRTSSRRDLGGPTAPGLTDLWTDLSSATDVNEEHQFPDDHDPRVVKATSARPNASQASRVTPNMTTD